MMIRKTREKFNFIFSCIYCVEFQTYPQDIVETVNYRLNHHLKILGILTTRVDHRNVVMNEAILQKMMEYFGEKLFKTQITVNTALNKSQLEGMPIFTFAPTSSGAADYKAFAEEVLERLRYQ